MIIWRSECSPDARRVPSGRGGVYKRGGARRLIEPLQQACEVGSVDVRPSFSKWGTGCFEKWDNALWPHSWCQASPGCPLPRRTGVRALLPSILTYPQQCPSNIVSGYGSPQTGTKQRTPILTCGVWLPCRFGTEFSGLLL